MNLITDKIPFKIFFNLKLLFILQNRNRSRAAINTPSDTIKHTHKYIILPNNSSANIIRNNLNKLGIKTVTLSSKTISGLLHSCPRRDIISDAGVYCNSVQRH